MVKTVDLWKRLFSGLFDGFRGMPFMRLVKTFRLRCTYRQGKFFTGYYVCTFSFVYTYTIIYIRN